ncbi:hypothetical protein [Aliiglaciecola litoralis]|uniref:HDOD domain-containing protein n=1 Tax=Aliiglaciecola litoralis TaxID=582857 RepID=A0ABP3X241_9ALTE
MDTHTESELHNDAIILSELERRFYLYLIGGDYEKLFYTIESNPVVEEQKASETISVSRILLESEVTQQQRLAQVCAGYADPGYKSKLDTLLAKRINDRLENEDDLLATCSQFKDLQPILISFGKDNEFNDAVFQKIEAIPWLVAQIKRFANNPEFQPILNLPQTNDVRAILKKLGYSLFIWLIPRFISEILHSNTHVSLRPLVARMRQYGRLTSGAIASLVVEEPADLQDKWMTYVLAGINIIPLFLLINLVNVELKKLLEEQLFLFKDVREDNSDKLSVIENYHFSSDLLRDVLSLEEILKPHILEDIGFEYFDPLPYLLGYADHTTPLADIFFQARAYAFYRQLFKTGRIQPQETAIFLRKHRIDKSMLYKLNKYDLTSTASHITLHQELIQRHLPEN